MQSSASTVMGSAPHHSGIAAETDSVVLTVSAFGRVLHASTAAERLFGYEAGEMLGFHVSLLLPTLTEAAIASDRRLQHLKYLGHCGVSFKATRSDGCDFHCSLSLVPLHDEQQDVYRLIINEAEGDTTALA